MTSVRGCGRTAIRLSPAIEAELRAFANPVTPLYNTAQRMKDYFPGDSYRTDPHTPRLLLDRILLGSRWALYACVSGAVLEARSGALRGVYDDEFWAHSSYRVFHSIELCGGRFEITGFDRLKRETDPLVVVSNHMSTLETMVFPVLIVPYRKMTFVVKEKLMRGPAFGPIMRSLSPISVTRKDARKDLVTVLETGSRLISEGYSIVVFPQSTRQNTFNPDHFNSLGVKLAQRAGVKVLPVAIKTDFWDNGRILRGFGPLRRRKTIHIAFGEAMSVHGRGREEHLAVVDFIGNNVRRWTAAEA